MQAFHFTLFLAAVLQAAVLTATVGCGTGADPGSDDSVLPQAHGAEPTPETNGDLQALAASLQKRFAEQRQTEAQQMLHAIIRGGRMGPGVGWFGPGQSRYSWDWLVKAEGLRDAHEISQVQFHGKPTWFTRLDRDGNGQIMAFDLDWSDNNPYVQRYTFTNQMLSCIDMQDDGRLTRDEWLALFEKAARGHGHVTTVDVAELLLQSRKSANSPGDHPDAATLLRSLERGEIGAFEEGPSLNSPAPDFELTTHDGKRTIRLSEQLGSKPIVLVFGNITCGPFRSMYPLVESLRRRYQDEVEFLAIYVRETHPRDGWRMSDNRRAGVDVAQPKTYVERVAAAGQCHAALKFSMPLLVDTINDQVAKSYSGLPIRLYVIDREGKVAYKSGRGPFGFKTGEMEQALLMTLIDQQMQAANSN